MRLVDWLQRHLPIVCLGYVLVIAPLTVYVASSSAGRAFEAALNLGLAALLGTWIGCVGLNSYMTYRHWERGEIRQAEPRKPSGRQQAQMAELMAIGFMPLGEFEVRWPWQAVWRHSWLLLHPSGYAEAEVGQLNRPTLCTQWPGGSYLVTSGAFGVKRVVLPDAAQGRVAGTVGELLRRHWEAAYVFGANRGEPRRIGTLAESLAAMDENRPQHRQVFRAVALSLPNLLTFGIVLAICAVLVLLAILA